MDDSIPKDMNECVRRLRAGMPEEDLELLKGYSEDRLRGLHFTLGAQIRSKWHLATDSPLTAHFSKLGVSCPDSMSQMIIQTLWRDLNTEAPGY